MNLYEQYGRQAEKLQEVSEAYLKTLELLRTLKDGKLDIKNVRVEKDGWEVVENDV